MCVWGGGGGGSVNDKVIREVLILIVVTLIYIILKPNLPHTNPEIGNDLHSGEKLHSL